MEGCSGVDWFGEHPMAYFDSSLDISVGEAEKGDRLCWQLMMVTACNFKIYQIS